MSAMELSIIQDEYRVVLLSCTDQHSKILQCIGQFYPKNRTEITTLPLPFRYKYLNFKKKSYPSPYDTMPKAIHLLRDADAILTTSHATVKMNHKLKITKPKIIYQYHGCGDRKYSFSKELGKFDYLLLPGKYYEKRLVEEHVTTKERTSIVGYPKLDYPVDVNHFRKQLFNNNKPIILYVPHWDPNLTSYKIWGKQILEYFNHNDKYNLIFSPHIQLKHWKFKYKYDIRIDQYINQNLYVDFGSERSVDSSYIKLADLYLGDVSSLIYEWIAIQPRPCLFLNAHQVNWREDVDYRNWQYGPVVETMDQLDRKLNEAVEDTKYLNIQSERIKEYMNLTDVSSSRRAAEAIYQYLKNNSGNLNR
jgi:FtsZ-binding cell division protein ZapB